MDFSWVAKYWPLLLSGAWQTVALLVISVSIGFLLAIGLAFAQVSGGRMTKILARAYCTFFRGTPLLIQLWLLYYGVGSLLPMIPGLRQSFMWPVLREGFFFAAVSFTLNYAAYEAEVLRGALPRAIRIALPTIAGEVVMQLKATPLAFTVTVMDLYAVAYKVRQDTLLVYEPLIVVTVFYLILTAIIARCFGLVEQQVPVRR
jgi:polar amino acid transport system permease protein